MTRTSGIHSGERGFTIIEVMVAVFILVLGVLGVATMANTANIQSSTSKARVGGTNLAREVLEDARSFPYADLSGNVPAGSGSTTLQSDLSGVGLTDASVANGWQIRRRNIQYTISVFTCIYDDPHDGARATVASGQDDVNSNDPYCLGSPAPGSGAPGLSNKVDQNPDDYRKVEVSVSWQYSGAPAACAHANQTVTSGNTGAIGRACVVQSELVANPSGGLGPAIASLTQASSTPGTIESGTTVNFNVVTVSPAQSVTWDADDGSSGTATQGVDSQHWNFTWTLGANTPRDGTHIVEAEAFLLNAPGVSKQVAVNLNRFIPSQVATAGGGIDSRNASAAAAIAWNPSTEGDVFGYTVYRPPPNGNNPPTAPNLTGGSADPAVCSTASISATQCFDTSAASAADANAICPPTPIANPGDKCLDYYVVPFDQLWTSISNPNSYGTNECGSGFTWNSGVGIPSPPNSVAPITQTGNWSTARLGCPSQFIAINYTQGLANSRPPAPTAASPSCSTSSDGLPVINWTPPSVNTDADGDTITSFRVYRDPGSTSPAYTDPASTLGFSTVAPQSFKDPTPPGTGLHSYYVTTVDDHFQESDPLSITWTVGGCP